MFGLGSDDRERIGGPAERLAASSAAPTARIDVAPQGGARDMEFERRWTREAGHAVRADVGDLMVFAELRAVGPIRNPLDRDFTREALEEFADARNYLVWRAQQELAKPSPEGAVTSLIADALGHVCAGFAAVTRLRAQERGA